MTKQEKTFVKAYISTGNATQAVKMAGYTGNYAAQATRAHRLLQRADIRCAISQKIKNIKGKIER